MTEVVSTANQSTFHSRQEMLQWINDSLKLSEKKLENLGTGSIFCQLFDLIYPGKLMKRIKQHILQLIVNKVNWKAKYENEFVANFKVLQQAFDRMNVNKPIDVNKLIKCKYQDNLEFLQWMRKYHDQFRKNTDKPYDAIARRNGTATIEKDNPDKIVSHPNLQYIKENSNLDSSFNNSSKQNYSRNNYKKSQTHFVPSDLGKNNSQSCQSSVSNLSIDHEYNQLDEADSSKPFTQASKFQMDSLIQKLKDERNFYFSKIQSIDQMLDNVIDQNLMSVIDIKNTQDQILTIQDDGSVTITDKSLNNIPTAQFEDMEGLEQLKKEILNTDQSIKKSDKKIKKNDIPKPYDSNQENKINLLPLPSLSYDKVSKIQSQGFKTPNSSKYHYEQSSQQDDFSQSVMQKKSSQNQSGNGQSKLEPLYEILVNDEKNPKNKSSFYDDFKPSLYSNNNYPGDLIKLQQVSELQLPNSDIFELNENLFESQDEDLLGNLE